MADVLDLVDNLNRVNVKDIAEETIRGRREIIADINASQMARGKRSDGSDILPSYSELTISLKKEKSGLAGVTDHVTLFDTGAHYRALYADIRGDEIEYGSHDEKSGKLQKKYDTSRGSIYGLDNDSREDLVEGFLRSDFETEIEKITGLKYN